MNCSRTFADEINIDSNAYLDSPSVAATVTAAVVAVVAVVAHW